MDASGNGAQYKTWVDTYTKLSKKDKSKQTISEAKELAAFFAQKYSSYLSSQSAAPVTPVVPVPVTPTPAPYIPIDYGSGSSSSGGTAIPETTPIVQTGQYTSNGQPIYLNQSTGQSFYYDTNGQPVYYNAATGRSAISSQALTQVPYVQMPTDGSGQMTNQYGQTVQIHRGGGRLDASGTARLQAARADAWGSNGTVRADAQWNDVTRRLATTRSATTRSTTDLAAAGLRPVN